MPRATLITINTIVSLSMEICKLEFKLHKLHEWHFTLEIPAAKFDKCKFGKLESNYKNIQVQLFLNQPRLLLPPVIHGHILSLRHCLYFTTNYRCCCVRTQSLPAAARLRRHCSSANTARRAARPSNRPSDKQTAFSARVRRDQRTASGTTCTVRSAVTDFASVLCMWAHKYLQIFKMHQLNSLFSLLSWWKKMKYKIRQPDIWYIISSTVCYFKEADVASFNKRLKLAFFSKFLEPLVVPQH